MSDNPVNPATNVEEPVVAESARGPESMASGDSSMMEELQRQVEEMRDQVLRAHAEMQNVRRRADNDVEKARKFAVERFAKDLLPVIDSLEKAVEACGQGELGGNDQVASIRQGVEMTLSLFGTVLSRFEVEVVQAEGQPFNPDLHEAMSMVPNAEVAPNTVIAVLQKGYTLHGRLLRPAMVMVSRAP